MVVVPGHGQGIHGPKKLVAATAHLSQSKIVWCIDPVPAQGGDHIEGKAISRIVRDKIQATFPTSRAPVTVTLIGWSHGASEALRAAGEAPDLFPQFLGLCPLGLLDRRPGQLVRSFFLEAFRILWNSVRQRRWVCLKDALRLGVNAGTGLARDLWHSRSARRLVEDIEWAGKRVTGREFRYPGKVVLLFGQQDTVVRWQDAFPECASPEQLGSAPVACSRKAFPEASTVEIRVIEGAHVAPESDAPTFVRTGLGLLDQLDVVDVR
jgi:pimeloyl-ACP methyl ester carboxylesterase